MATGVMLLSIIEIGVELDRGGLVIGVAAEMEVQLDWEGQAVVATIEVDVQLDRRSLLVTAAAEVEVQLGGGGGLAMWVAIQVEVQLGSGNSIEEAVQYIRIYLSCLPHAGSLNLNTCKLININYF